MRLERGASDNKGAQREGSRCGAFEDSRFSA
jgi:hypothetical protein